MAKPIVTHKCRFDFRFGIWIFDYGICIADFFYFGLWILLPIRQFLCCYIKMEILEEIGAIILWTKHGIYSKEYSLRKRVGPFLSNHIAFSCVVCFRHIGIHPVLTFFSFQKRHQTLQALSFMEDHFCRGLGSAFCNYKIFRHDPSCYFIQTGMIG